MHLQGTMKNGFMVLCDLLRSWFYIFSMIFANFAIYEEVVNNNALCFMPVDNFTR